MPVLSGKISQMQSDFFPFTIFGVIDGQEVPVMALCCNVNEIFSDICDHCFQDGRMEM